LAGVRDAINAANAGVSASIVNDGTGQRLVLASKYGGAAGAMRISVADDATTNTDATGLSQLAYDASTGGTTNLTEVAVAQDAKAVVNGITITSANNTLSGAIDGVSLSLNKAAPGTTTTVTVARNVAAAASAVQSFVSAYNNANSTLTTLSAYNADTKTGAVLQGDSTLHSVQARVRSALSGIVAHAGGYASLSEIGIAFQKDGSLLVNSGKLNVALSNPSKDAASVFAAVGTATDSLVSFGNAASTADPGSYAIVVSQLATRGSAAGSAPAALTITAGVNDTLALAVDGTAASVTLAAGTYTPATLSAMLQSRINGNAALVAAGGAVEATASGGVLSLASRKWGSASSVSVTGGSAATDLFGTAASTAGVNATGTIGGVAATGSGQSLTAKGLTVNVTGGTTGSRGTLNFSRGVADSMNTLVNNMLTGTLAARTTGIQSTISDIADQRAAFEGRMTQVEAAMRAQFIALDTAMTSMQNTSSFLTQQLSAMNKTNSSSG
jgi:flagellar hook-associated protein 2